MGTPSHWMDGYFVLGYKIYEISSLRMLHSNENLVSREVFGGLSCLRPSKVIALACVWTENLTSLLQSTMIVS